MPGCTVGGNVQTGGISFAHNPDTLYILDVVQVEFVTSIEVEMANKHFGSQGEFSGGLPNGRGEFFYGNGEKALDKYVGDFVDGAVSENFLCGI